MSELRIARSSPTSFTVFDEDRELGVYSFDSLWQHPHWHPLRTRNTGAVLTSRAPYDHPWHCGHWWSWKQIDDAMCWNPALHGETSTASVAVASTTLDRDAIVQIVDWRSDQTQETLLHETRRMAVRLLDESTWCIDWTIECSSDRPRVLSSTPWPEPSWGGYAGLSFRPVRSMAFEEVVRCRGADGQIHTGDDCHARIGPWLTYSGALDGVALPRAPRPAPLGTVALFTHPDNPVSNERWWATGTANLHSRFFCIGTGFLMDGAIALQPGAPLQFRYRCAFSDGVPAAEKLDSWCF
jgi:hypothetical protein